MHIHLYTLRNNLHVTFPVNTDKLVLHANINHVTNLLHIEG